MTNYQKITIRRLFNQFKESSTILTEEDIYYHIKDHVIRMDYKKHY